MLHDCCSEEVFTSVAASAVARAESKIRGVADDRCVHYVHCLVGFPCRCQSSENIPKSFQ